MNIRKTIQLYMLSIFTFTFIFNVMPSFCQESAFTGVVSYLKGEYGTPFQIAGRVKEVAQDNILFNKNNTIDGISVGQGFWACDHKKGVSPHLQRQVARLRVEALFSQTVMASVEQVMARDVEPDDWVLTPPSPIVHVYSNIESKHAFPAYQELIKELLDAGFQIKEVKKDVIPGGLGDNDLLLRFESDADHLVCRLIRGKEGKLLFYESQKSGLEIVTLFPAGHDIQTQSLPISVPSPTSGKAPENSTYEEEGDFYRLDKAFTKIVAFDLEGDGITDLALLNDNGVSVYEIAGTALSEKQSYTFKKNVFPLNLHAMDMDHDGKDELLVTLAESAVFLGKEDNRLCSEILKFNGDSLDCLVKNWPYYLNVIFNRTGHRVALAQKEGEYIQYMGPVSQITWDAESKQLKIMERYRPAAGVYSIYQFNLLPNDSDRLIILEKGNDLHGYFTPEEKVDASSHRNYGDFKETGYPLKLEKDQYLGGFSEKKTFQTVYAPRRFESSPPFDEQCFLIYKERNTTILKKILGANRGTDQIVGVKWYGNRLVETWQSRKFACNVLDFTFLLNPKRIMVLYRDNDGSAALTCINFVGRDISRVSEK
ncbi:hypothetical protein DSCO28_38360 [Desulfosarcina ovata subsp. sediminis]|uniref:VCBS repeat-containing protein n=1 Tax=Desulfosarcina ovata subsp. sediminis TaxID=885957 RepID=A0A5K7ZST6_9BACT|nr:VCBS repeat-containing protein [Desulfosarcina ovata]BBO83270.1 hypothetical protein DSCO28_38360 [Desulfosarcina ovata subsp. sediminis]